MQSRTGHGFSCGVETASSYLRFTTPSFIQHNNTEFSLWSDFVCMTLYTELALPSTHHYLIDCQ